MFYEMIIWLIVLLTRSDSVEDSGTGDASIFFFISYKLAQMALNEKAPGLDPKKIFLFSRIKSVQIKLGFRESNESHGLDIQSFEK